MDKALSPLDKQAPSTLHAERLGRERGSKRLGERGRAKGGFEAWMGKRCLDERTMFIPKDCDAFGFVVQPS